jgi:hypothetical protein
MWLQASEACIKKQRSTWVGPHWEGCHDGFPADREANPAYKDVGGSLRLTARRGEREPAGSLPKLA